MSNPKTTRFFSQVFDDIIRSPNLTSHDIRLFMVMISYCSKTKETRICKLTKTAMAGIMRIAERTVYDSLRTLQSVGLIKIGCLDGDHRYPIYEIVSNPSVLSPSVLVGNKLNDAISYVRDAGGVKALQRRSFKRRKEEKRTGRPATWTNGSTLEDAADGHRHDDSDPILPSGPPPLPHRQPITGSTLPVPAGLTASSTGSVLPVLNPKSSGVLAVYCESTGSVLPPVLAVYCNSTGSTLPPVREVSRESKVESPNGQKSVGHVRDLALKISPAAPPAASEMNTNSKTRRCISLDSKHRTQTNTVSDPEEESHMAKPSKEELEVERARKRSLAKGSRSRIVDVGMASGSSSDAGVAPEKRRRGAGAPITKKDSTHDVLEKHLTADPDTVSKVPDSPFHLYVHFSKVVRKRYPDARLPKGGDGKYLRWGKTLLKIYSQEELYEMIQVLVLDYESIATARIFFKFSGTPTPIYEQFFSNADTLVTFIGLGIISPPSVRFSAYAEDYNKRHGKGVNAGDDPVDLGRTGTDPIDPIEALRDQVNGRK